MIRTADTGSLVLRVDRLRLEQAVGNLVDNALRHGAGVVTLGAEMHGADLTIRITDEGPGLPESIAGDAFRPFQRGPGKSAGNGSGLGLAIASEIVTAHGGRIATRSTEDGFTVELALPAVAAAVV
jgi:signal transduction histidine kinase